MSAHPHLPRSPPGRGDPSWVTPGDSGSPTGHPLLPANSNSQGEPRPQKLPREVCPCPSSRRPLSPVVGPGGDRRLGTTPSQAPRRPTESGGHGSGSLRPRSQPGTPLSPALPSAEEGSVPSQAGSKARERAGLLWQHRPAPRDQQPGQGTHPGGRSGRRVPGHKGRPHRGGGSGHGWHSGTSCGTACRRSPWGSLREARPLESHLDMSHARGDAPRGPVPNTGARRGPGPLGRATSA